MTGYTSEWTSTTLVTRTESPYRIGIVPAFLQREEEDKITEESTNEESHTRILCSDDFTIRVSRVYCHCPSFSKILVVYLLITGKVGIP